MEEVKTLRKLMVAGSLALLCLAGSGLAAIANYEPPEDKRPPKETALLFGPPHDVG